MALSSAEQQVFTALFKKLALDLGFREDALQAIGPLLGAATGSQDGLLSSADKTTIGTSAIAAASASAAQLAKLTKHILAADVIASASINVGAALPANAIVLGHEVSLVTQFTGGTLIAVKMNLGGTDATGIVNAFDVLAATAGHKYSPGYEHFTTHGTHCTGSYSAEQLVAAFTPTGDVLANLVAGDLTITVWYCILA